MREMKLFGSKRRSFAMNLTTLVRDFAFAKWADVLKDPESGKATTQLFSTEDITIACCLGHACRALDPDCIYLDDDYGFLAEGQFEVLPHHLAELLGINPRGDFKCAVPYGANTHISLSDLNDHSSIRPADIAHVILSQYKFGNFMTK